MVVAEDAESRAEEVVRTVHDLCHGGRPALGDLGKGCGQVELLCGVYSLDEDVEFATAGQADGKGVVVGVAEPGALRGAPVVEHLLARFVHCAFDAASGDAAIARADRGCRDASADGPRIPRSLDVREW
ncbi:hypothetical protein OIE43_42865 [Streptomyces pseudovenezuelae]|uniref:hypothetical protein n=1 Tax=Streptomyces pseudovenezuelae TaxID=67350 RepID=UPI002E2F210D|nr:hypothetical protein [Streptomyces pseudovenezuelae]